MPEEGEGRTKARGSRASSIIRVLSPRILPPDTLDDGSTVCTTTRAQRNGISRFLRHRNTGYNSEHADCTNQHSESVIQGCEVLAERLDQCGLARTRWSRQPNAERSALPTPMPIQGDKHHRLGELEVLRPGLQCTYLTDGRLATSRP